MQIRIFTLFPEYFASVLTTSLLGKASENGHLDIRTVDLRAFGLGRHKQCDDVPYGGGAGMVMKPEPIVNAFESEPLPAGGLRIFMSPRGEVFRHGRAMQLAEVPALHILCGRYEGVDQRVIDGWIDLELSVGDFVLAGGESAASIVIEAVTRYIPGVLGSESSLEEESFVSGVLEYPQYTRPAEFRGQKVPEILLSGHHAQIESWRREQSIQLTRQRRPDLLSVDEKSSGRES